MADSRRQAGSLDVLVLRARFRPQASLAFPFGAAVPVRGALGFCLPEDIFRPHRDAGPSGLRDAPRPFVLRVRHLDGKSFVSGESFEIGLNLFAPAMLPVFEDSLRRLASTGLGPNRIRLDWDGLDVSSETLQLGQADLCRMLEVCFLSPTEIKGWDEFGLPPFEVLAARARDRVSALSALYGRGALDLDFRGLAGRARSVRAVSGELTRILANRTSSRTGQTHPLGGVIGSVRYAGELSEFVPLLLAACRTGVGRQTVWGHGEIAIHPSLGTPISRSAPIAT